MRFRGGWVLLLIVIFARCGIATPTITPAQLDQIHADIQAALVMFDITGAAFTLVWPDGVYTAGFGSTHAQTITAVAPDSRFAVASAIKPIATAWIHQQLIANHLSWQTRLADLWPRLDLGAAGDLTLSDIIGQTSGYPRDDWVWIGRDLSPHDLALHLRESAPIAPTGRLFTYHNVLFALALRGVENHTGTSFMFNPATVTGHERTLSGDILPVEASPPSHSVMSVVLDAGLSANDAAGLLKMLLAQPNLFNTPTISASGAACCPLGSDIRYGRGLFIENYHGLTLWLHDGEGIGFTSVILLDPARRVGIFIVANHGQADAFIHAVRYHVLERLYGLPPTASSILHPHWERDMATQRAMAHRAIAPQPADMAFMGDYGSDTRLDWDSRQGLTLQRGHFVWRLRTLAAGYAVFDHGPMIGQSVDLVCADGQRRIVSGQTVLGIGTPCRNP